MVLMEPPQLPPQPFSHSTKGDSKIKAVCHSVHVNVIWIEDSIVPTPISFELQHGYFVFKKMSELGKLELLV